MPVFPNELIELLEKIISQGHTDFSTNENLQNLLILTAIKADCAAGCWLHRKDRQFQWPSNCQNCLALREYELFEEAFLIYKSSTWMRRLLMYCVPDSTNGTEYENAERVDKSDVWDKLAKAQLDPRLTP